MNARKFYVYEWFVIESLEIFHVGKGTGVRRFRTTQRNNYFERIVNKYPCAVRIYAMNLTEYEANEIEQDRIAELKLIGQAKTNFHRGGNGGFTGNYKSVSESLKGRPKSDEYKKKLSESMKGIKYSAERNKKVSESLKGRKQSPEQIAKRIATTKRNKLLKEQGVLT